jgi:hypothetical protein
MMISVSLVMPVVTSVRVGAVADGAPVLEELPASGGLKTST